MDHLFQLLALDLPAGVLEEPQLPQAVAADALRQGMAVLVLDDDGVAGGEVAPEGFDAHSEEAGAAVADGSGRAGVHREGAGGGARVLQPEAEASTLVLQAARRRHVGAAGLAAEELGEGPLLQG